MKLVCITAGLAVASLSSAYAQQATLSGTVLDAQTQQALPGVTVMVPGTSLGTTTDAQGRFEPHGERSAISRHARFLRIIPNK